MNKINNILIEDKVLTEMWDCNVSVCGGSCCESPEGLSDDECGGIIYGEDEVSYIEENVSEHGVTDMSSIVPKKCEKFVKENGWYQCGEDELGKFYVTRMLKGECVFRGDKGCVLSKYNAKPISCSIYPLELVNDNILKVADEPHNPLCERCKLNGVTSKVLLIDKLRNELIRNFGEEFYVRLKELSNAAIHKGE